MPSDMYAAAVGAARSAELEARVAELEATIAAQARRIAELEQREASLHPVVEVAERTAERAALLSVAGAILSSSLDYHRTLGRIADMLVPRLGDRCLMELTDLELGPARLLVLAEEQEQAMSGAPWRYAPPPAQGEHPFAEVLGQRGATLIAEPTAAQLQRLAIAGPVVCLGVPLSVRGEAVGLIVFASPRGYSGADLVLGDELAQRVSQALEHAWLARAWRWAHERTDEALAMLDLIFATAPIGLAVLDADLRYIQVNPALAAIDGLPVEAYPGRAPTELLSRLAPTLEPVFRQVLATGAAVSDLAIHGVIDLRSDQHRDWLASCYPVRRPDGAITGVGVVVVEITEYKRAEAVLRRQADTLREQAALLDHAHVLIHDLDGRIIAWNKGAEALYGWRADEAIGRLGHDLLQTRFPESLAAYQERLFGDGVWEGELVHRRRDGSELVVASHQVVFWDSGGSPRRVLEVNNDITALRRAEQALRDRDEQLRLAYDATLLGTWRHDIAAGTIRLDARAQIHYGVAADTLPIDQLLERVHPGDRARLKAEIAATIVPSSEGRYATEFRVVYPDGRVRWLSVHARIFYVGQGAERRPLLGSGTSQDISARKEDEAALRASEANLRAILASTTQAFILLDTELRLVQWNDLAETFIAERIGSRLRVGARIGDYMLPEALPVRSALMRRALLGERSHIELNMGSEEAPLWLALEYAPVREADGQIRGVCIGVLDVTARRQAEAELRASESRFRLLAEQAQDLIYRYRLAPTPGFEYVSPSALAMTGYTPDEHYADPQLGFKLVYPDDQHLLAALPQGSSAVSAPLTLRWRRKDGTLIWTEQVNRLITDESGHPVAIEGIARDITGRMAAEEQVRAALTAEQAARLAVERAVERSARLQAVTAALAGTLTREAVIEVITCHGTAATGAVASVVSLIDQDRQQLTIVGWTGRSAGELRAFMTAPLSAQTPPCTAVRSGEPVWLSCRAEGEARFSGLGQVMAHFGDEAYACLPLLTGGRAIGAVSFSYQAPNAFAPEDRAFLITLAQQCAQALERAQLYGEVLASHARLQAVSERLVAVQEEERRHLARELHDEIGQALTGLNLVLAMGPSLPPEQLHVQLAEARRLVTTLITQVRHRSLDLRPSMLDDLGLRPALAWYLARYSEQTGIALDVQLQGLDERFSPLVELTAYRIVQEALTNVARHAHVDRASVAVWVVNDQLVIAVTDEGRGFDVEAARGAHGSSGLAGMRERAVLLGGELTIEAEPGAGTRLLANLPVNRPVAHQESL